MIRAGTAVAAVVIAMITVSAQDRSVYRAGTDAVALDVSVMRGNTPVTDLMASDFDVRDNGVRQKVQALDVDALPIDVTIAVDTSGSMFQTLEGVAKDARVVTSLLRPTDRVRLITLETTVSRVMDFQPVGTELKLPVLEPGGATSLYDGVAAAIMAGPGADRRHLALIFTDGMDTVSALSSDAVVEFAKRTNTVAWIFLAVPVPKDPDGVPPPPTPLVVPPPGPPSRLNTRRFWSPTPLALDRGSTMDDVAAMTGGRVEPFYFEAAAAVPRALSRAIEQFRSSYLLRYTVQGAATPGWHQVSVSITKPGRFEIRTRRGYFSQ